MGNIFGELASLATALCWTVTSLAFESAGKKVGSLSVNLIRLVLAFFLIGIFSYLRNGLFVATDASLYAWGWLAISGVIGFVIGDLLLFQAFVVIGARVSMLIMALTPPIAAFFGWVILNEQMPISGLIGMAVTIIGIIIVIMAKETHSKTVKIKYPIRGVLLAFGGAVGQGLGLVFSKLGMKDYDPFLSTQIRILAGIVGFSILFFVLGKWKHVFMALCNKKAMVGISIGSIFGPFLGVSLSLLAIQHTTTGIASTIMAIVPVLIIAPAVIIFKEKITLKEILGAIIAFAGVVMFFIF
ncbi:DMT family transporter [Saccharicrinis fermentans]|uniref:DMT family transporter n=1 Tax=Saccharicrinis fermentans TaxID=982 RepID=UPI000483E39B|nr:DMT family transporter [Saccharicrinis fermentans]